MNADRSMLDNLVEMLEDGRGFYDEAAQLATDGSRDLYQDKSRHYAAALDDIRGWIVRAGIDAEAHGADFNALLERVYAALRDKPHIEAQPVTVVAAWPHASIAPSRTNPSNASRDRVGDNDGLLV